MKRFLVVAVAVSACVGPPVTSTRQTTETVTIGSGDGGQVFIVVDEATGRARAVSGPGVGLPPADDYTIVLASVPCDVARALPNDGGLQRYALRCQQGKRAGGAFQIVPAQAAKARAHGGADGGR